jgi:hypothetical protein
MKASDLKRFIKESVKEAIQEELKDILLEAVKSPKQVIRESYTPPPPHTSIEPGIPEITMDKRQAYIDILGETAMSFTSQDVPRFNPGANVDPINGQLPAGDLGMDQIMNLMSNR